MKKLKQRTLWSPRPRRLLKQRTEAVQPWLNDFTDPADADDDEADSRPWL
ncbi:hypothetical protein cypCar_00016215 [Cyprinus carpio]|nr:hypothetical protein cypCar_00016215 [Cyprinus carpio]